MENEASDTPGTVHLPEIHCFLFLISVYRSRVCVLTEVFLSVPFYWKRFFRPSRSQAYFSGAASRSPSGDFRLAALPQSQFRSPSLLTPVVPFSAAFYLPTRKADRRFLFFAFHIPFPISVSYWYFPNTLSACPAQAKPHSPSYSEPPVDKTVRQTHLSAMHSR